MSFQDYIEKAMIGQLILRIDITRTSAGTNVEAEAINYWSDDEGACVIHVKYARSRQIPSIHVGVVTQEFMIERRKREITYNLRPIVVTWEDMQWDLQTDKLVRVRDEGKLTWERLNPLNVLAAQELARLQTAIELTMAHPLDVAIALCDLLAGEQLLRSEIQHTLRDASRRLDSIIRDANRQLASIAQL